jgi:hypothetical protein
MFFNIIFGKFTKKGLLFYHKLRAMSIIPFFMNYLGYLIFLQNVDTIDLTGQILKKYDIKD